MVLDDASADCDKLELADADSLASVETPALGDDDTEMEYADAEYELLLDELAESVPAVVALALNEGEGLPVTDIWSLGD